MPFLIKARNNLPGEVSWEDVWTEEQTPAGYVEMGTAHGKKPVVQGPIPYRLSKGRLRKEGEIPDIVPGRWSRDIIVSERVRDMIREEDPVAHHFIPLELTLKDGAMISTHFLFVAGDLIDGIDANASEVTPKIFGGKLAYYSVGGDPRIVWCAEAIAGRAIWVDRYLIGQIIISDKLMKIFKDSKVEKFASTASPARL